jgi:hypothetical protein
MISLKNTLVTLSLQEMVADEYVIVDLVLFIFLWRFLSEKNICSLSNYFSEMNVTHKETDNYSF